MIHHTPVIIIGTFITRPDYTTTTLAVRFKLVTSSIHRYIAIGILPLEYVGVNRINFYPMPEFY